MTAAPKKIAILATGSELINGDITNSNSQYFRQQLIDHGMHPGNEVLVGDHVDEIAEAIRFLLPNHAAILTIGGLGPTMDDVTRFGLAKALDLELELNTQAWQWIVEILKRKNLAIAETNRQQALLPTHATPIHNPNGTACACYLAHDNKDIFMLPGPPNECFPIFNHFVLETLTAKKYNQPLYKKSWLLFSVSESEIASQIEPFMAEFPTCILGFRVHYPYLEVKIAGAHEKEVHALAELILQKIGPAVISTERQSATSQLLQKLNTSKFTLQFVDEATGGLLAHTLSNPTNYSRIRFYSSAPGAASDFLITISGLTAYWQGNQGASLSLQIQIQSKDQTQTIEKLVPYRGSATLNYAVELIALELLKIIF